MLCSRFANITVYESLAYAIIWNALDALRPIDAVVRSMRSHRFRTRRFRIRSFDGTVRREYLDHLFFWSAIDLTPKLEAFADYYNRHRVRRSLTAPRWRNAPAHLPHRSRVLLFANSLGRSVVAARFTASVRA
jgi:hypothetical protein